MHQLAGALVFVAKRWRLWLQALEPVQSEALHVPSHGAQRCFGALGDLPVRTPIATQVLDQRALRLAQSAAQPPRTRASIAQPGNPFGFVTGYPFVDRSHGNARSR